MSNQSPLLLMKQLQADVLKLFRGLDIPTLSSVEQQLIGRMKSCLVDARLEIQDYELAETRADQLRRAKVARKYLLIIERMIVSNPAEVFGAVDTAHLIAQIEQIREQVV